MTSMRIPLSLLLLLAVAAPAFAQTHDPTEQVQPKRRRKRPNQSNEDKAKPVAPPAPAPIVGAPVATQPAAPPAAPAGSPAGVAAPSPLPLPTEAPGEDAELYKCLRRRPNERIKITLKPDTGLTDLVAWAMGFTCKSFIFGNAISGRATKVTIIAPSEMTPTDAYRLFLVGLQTMNLTVVPKGNTLEIVESQKGREMPIPVYRPTSGSGNAPNVDQVVRVILRPEHVNPDELTAVLTAMKTSSGVITPIPAAGVVIVTDYGSTIDKMMDVIKDVDAQTAAEKIYIIYLNNADAQDMSAKLSDIFGIGRGAGPGAPPSSRRQAVAAAAGQPPQPGAPAATAGGGGGGGSESITPSKVIADTRTNSLIVIASERAYQRILALVHRLDPPIVEGEAGQIHVYPLSNADAEVLSGTLNALVTGQAQRPSGPARPGAPPVAQPAPAAVAAGGVAGATSAFEGAIKLAFDKPTNSLVIISSAKDFYSLRDVVRKLDKPRRQVFVEASILEVSVKHGRSIGFSYHGGAQASLKNENDTTIIGGVESTQLTSLALPSTLEGLIGGVIGPKIPGLDIPSVGVMFQLMQTSGDVNVLSSPNILTTDNEPAEISVGQNIPYLSSSLSGLSGLAGLAGAAAGSNPAAANPLLGLSGLGQSVARADIALTLKLTPHVNDSDSIRLEVDLEISDLLPGGGALGPSWSKRRVKSPIVVRDQQPVVIGGLMADKISITETKVPLLGDIPLLGYLFKYKSTEKVKTNLLVFLTPYIIKDQADIERIFEEKTRERREFLESFTAFDDRSFDKNIDYRRKRGLLAEIDRAVQLADDDERALQDSQKRRARRVEEGAVELGPATAAPDGADSTPDQPQPSAPPPLPPPGE